jgi:hypothetical protein
MNSCSKFWAKAQRKGENRIPQDRDLQHAHPAEAIGQGSGKPLAVKSPNQASIAFLPR